MIDARKNFSPQLKQLSLLLFAVYIATASARAQTPVTEPGTGRAETSEIRALAVGLEGDLRELHILDGENQSVGTLQLMVRSFSAKFVCPIVEGSIRFGLKSGVDEEGETLYSPLATVPWKDEFTAVTLVFIPKSYSAQADLEQPYTIQVMDMGADDFESGTTKVVNFAPVTAYVRFGEHKKVVEYGQAVTIPKINEVMRANMVQLNVYHMVGDDPHTVKKTRVRYLERIRYLIVLYPDVVNRRMGVASILDYGNLF
ncbi:MAG: hypothetical protein GVY36_07175 [Verrucomicrobia bacterium]|jgi:hypothetical protein|nr:hypothetical protein [Verrucomicrobiota bacterium]